MATAVRAARVARWCDRWAMVAPRDASTPSARARRRRGRRLPPGFAPQPLVWSLDRDEVRAALERDWR